MVMICSHCHTPNPTNAEICSQCGSGLDIGADVGLGATLEVSQSASTSTGTDFGPRYQVESLLGSGGMGKVYKARDRELDRTVAIKVLRPDLMTDPMALQRFKHELLLASSISHPQKGERGRQTGARKWPRPENSPLRRCTRSWR